MANTEFMDKKYSVDELVDVYLNDIRALKAYVKSPIEETKLQTYLQAASAFKGISLKDMTQFVITLGRSAGNKAVAMRQAFPIMLGNRVTQPSDIDIEYARLLLAYCIAFKKKRSNLKEWLLSFILSSRFSPLKGFFDSELKNVIDNTRQNITSFEDYIAKTRE